MPEPGNIVEIVRVRPNAGSEQDLLDLREALVQSYRDASPSFVHATLVQLEEGGEWVDLWYWTDRPGAEAALADPTDEFKRWASMVEVLSLEWATTTADHAR